MPLLLAYSPVAQPRAGRANQNPCEVVPLYEGLATGSSVLWHSVNGKSGPMGSRSAMGHKNSFVLRKAENHYGPPPARRQPESDEARAVHIHQKKDLSY